MNGPNIVEVGMGAAGFFMGVVFFGARNHPTPVELPWYMRSGPNSVTYGTGAAIVGIALMVGGVVLVIMGVIGESR